MTITQADREAAALVQAIVDAGHGYSINLTRLVDGESEYTLTYRGETRVYESYEDALDALRGLEEAEKTRAATEFLKQFRIAALEEAAKVCDEQQQEFLSPEYSAGQPFASFGERFACGQCAEAIRNLAGEE